MLETSQNEKHEGYVTLISTSYYIAQNEKFQNGGTKLQTHLHLFFPLFICLSFKWVMLRMCRDIANLLKTKTYLEPLKLPINNPIEEFFFFQID